MKYTSTCAECGKAFTRNTKAKADFSAEIHRRRTHMETKATGEKFTATCGECGKTFERPTQRKLDLSLYHHRYETHGIRKTKPLLEKHQNTNSIAIHVNYCPNCGVNLVAVATGIAMSK